ncbi:Arginine-glutamic acid dipeptide repeats protein [Trichinella patagoniensis]|uniref:Arginine-glutamic acid dipeptide repeats protein n=1 Tax=Trichinella patagoniensis TaxID=990121 RepID=A0A0V0ZUD2_9BILA|nr:Arginine-glutamic acid dipeptide repeats protein [Trichinella patagoniensis]
MMTHLGHHHYLTKRDQLNVLVKWYYRPCELPELVYDSLLQERLSEEHCLALDDANPEGVVKENREIFISDAVDTYSVAALRHLVQTGQPVRICLEAQYFRLHASAVRHQVFAEIRHSLNAHIANIEDQLQLLFLNPHISAINSTVIAFCSVVCLEVRYQVSYQQGWVDKYCLFGILGQANLLTADQLNVVLCDSADHVLLLCDMSVSKGKSHVQHYKEISSAREFQPHPDHFYYILGYNPETNRLATIQGEIRVGLTYQARLPEYKSDNDSCEEEEAARETLVWAPNRIADSDLVVFLQAARSMAAFAGMCDSGSTEDGCLAAARDQITINAFNALHRNDYDTGKALQELVKNPLPLSADKRWSEEETKKFVKGLKQYGKNFFKIRKELLPHKQTADLVEYYYLWKKYPSALHQRPRARHRRAQTSVLRRVKPNGSSRAASRPTSSEFLDLSSASENECDSDESNSKDSSVYACHHCYTTNSKNWHHAGKERTLLCTECRLHFKKYGELRPVVRPRTPPSVLFKPAKEELEEMNYTGGIRTRRSNKDYGSAASRRHAVTPTAAELEKTRHAGNSRVSCNGNNDKPLGPKSPSSASTSSTSSSINAAELPETKKLPRAKGGGKKRKVEKTSPALSTVDETVSTATKRSTKKSQATVTVEPTAATDSTTSELNNNGAAASDNDDITPDHSSSVSSPPLSNDRSATPKKLAPSIEESIDCVVRGSLIANSPKWKSPNNNGDTTEKPESSSPTLSTILPVENAEQQLQLIRTNEKATIKAASDVSAAVLRADALSTPPLTTTMTTTTTATSVLVTVKQGEHSATPISSPLAVTSTSQQLPSELTNSHVNVLKEPSSLVLSGLLSRTSAPSIPAHSLCQNSQAVCTTTSAITSAACSVIKETVMLLKEQQPNEQIDSEDDVDYNGSVLPAAKEPEPKIDDGTECHRSANAIFRRHWYRGSSNSCSRTDLIFVPLPDSPLAKKRQKEATLRRQTEIKEEKKERHAQYLSSSTSTTLTTTSAQTNLTVTTPSTGLHATASPFGTGLPNNFNMLPMTTFHASSHDLPALQRLKEYASAAASACTPGSPSFHQAALLDPVLQYRILSGLYGPAEKERLEQELRERQHDLMKRDYELSKSLFSLSSTAPLSHQQAAAAGNIGLPGVSPMAGGDARQMLGGFPGQFSPVNSAQAMAAAAAAAAAAAGSAGAAGGNAASTLPLNVIDQATLDRVQTDRLLHERMQLERLAQLYPSNPILRIEIDRLSAALSAIATQHHTHSHTHSHTHLHIHPSSASSSGAPESTTTSSIAATPHPQLWGAGGAAFPTAAEQLMQQYSTLFRPTPGALTALDNGVGASHLMASVPGLPPPGLNMHAATVLDPLAAERLQQLQQEHMQRHMLLERDRLMTAQQQVAMQHNEMMRRLQQEGSLLGNPGAPGAVGGLLRSDRPSFEKP